MDCKTNLISLFWYIETNISLYKIVEETQMRVDFDPNVKVNNIILYM